MDDPVRTLTRLDDALRNHQTEEMARRGSQFPRPDDYENDPHYWDGYMKARAIVSRHLKAARIERGH